jgi:hypothetical protein
MFPVLTSTVHVTGHHFRRWHTHGTAYGMVLYGTVSQRAYQCNRPGILRSKSTKSSSGKIRAPRQLLGTHGHPKTQEKNLNHVKCSPLAAFAVSSTYTMLCCCVAIRVCTPSSVHGGLTSVSVEAQIGPGFWKCDPHLVHYDSTS